MAEVDTLWDLLPGCWPDDRPDWGVPVWNEEDCRREPKIIPTGTLDCTFVQNCMQTTIDWINTTLVNLQSESSQHNIRLTNLESHVSEFHSHSNKALLDSLTDTWWAEFYLWEDGNYHQIPLSSDIFYQYIQQGNVDAPQRRALAFSDDFQVTDDAVNNRTIITLVGWSSGWSTTDDYVASWSYNSTSQVLRLTRTLWTNIDIDLSSIPNSDELVKVGNSGTARFLNNQDFEDSWSDIIINKQRSIISDINGIMLVWDLATPGNNMVYGTDVSGNKWWYAQTWLEYSQTASSANSVTVAHNLGKHPVPACVDSAGDLVQPAWVTYTGANQLVVTFTTAFTGTIYVS